MEQRKTLDEIYQEMLACYGQRTGLEPEVGCDLAARLYALAAQVYALQVQTEWVARQAFPQTAEGVYLDRHAQIRGLERKRAVAAEGVVRFTVKEPSAEARAIPAGTVCMTAGLIRFETVEEAAIAAGETSVNVPVRAVEAGAAGNVAAGTIVSMAVAPLGVSSCTNPVPCAGGGDAEEDDALRQRVLDTYRRLPNGANAAFYEQEALSFEQVAAVTVLARPRGIGTVDVVAATLEGVPDQDLLDELTAYFQSRREIAVDVQVRAPVTAAVNVAVQVAPAEGYTQEQAAAQAEEAVRSWFTGERLGQTVLRAQLSSLIYNCAAVGNCTLTAPAADVAVAADGLPVLGTVTVEGMA